MSSTQEKRERAKELLQALERDGRYEEIVLAGAPRSPAFVRSFLVDDAFPGHVDEALRQLESLTERARKRQHFEASEAARLEQRDNPPAENPVLLDIDRERAEAAARAAAYARSESGRHDAVIAALEAIRNEIRSLKSGR